MISPASLALYSAVIVAGALVGAAVPVARPQTRQRTVLFLSFSAGVMLGAAFFHMLPEAIHEGGAAAVPWVVAGFLFLFLLERFILVHWCEEPEFEACEVHGFHAHAPDGTGHEHAPGAHAHGAGPALAVAGGAVAATGHDHGIHGTVGLAAFVGLSVHTLTDGFALGAATDAGVGASVCLAILFHKVPSSFSLAAILLHERYRPRTALLLSVGFAMAIPLGAFLYYGLAGGIDREAFGPRALAFSAGSFLHLAVADLIPDLHREKAQRLPLSLALLVGLGVMLALSVFGPEHAHGAAGAVPGHVVAPAE